MKILILQHTATEGAGMVLDWCVQKGVKVSYINLYEPHPEFDLDELVQLVVVLGGPMSVNAENDYPWLKPEKHFIRQCVEAQIPILGICLGAQLIASALGSQVVANSEVEIGWHKIEGLTNQTDVFPLPVSMPVFHWHGETFELPSHSVRLAKSDACANQGFQLGDKVIGLQFHPEITVNTIEAWIADAGESLKPSKYVQSPNEMRAKAKTYLPDSKALLFEVLDYLVK
ncbi:MAG: type 1 glutamine amidotransferase [Thiomicrorhabdus chilensis]|uniref:type 1 glutamine amidotransferase n=1 Tax=Thiomicrorhabdus chilensis TaxID=63656 RepID=UPI00299DE5C8|nr:type 1 glutamine amidotransferase [Thiomicrorhabdus chilensis]MDX1347404.1 type 1 glutamine amidotransferase [Thiomicrorhabdus chilensis]